MKVGVLTFHWAGNYGAVLQAFALQRFLMDNKIEVQCINYLPRRCIWNLRFFDIVNHRFCKNIMKSMVCSRFVKKWLSVSVGEYHSYSELVNCSSKYDAIIAGSDQIWNESFLMTAEKKPTLSYYLDFMPQNKKRISYAASFGTNSLSDEIITYGLPALKKFNFISVREENAVDMLREHGIKATAVCDPTLLIEQSVYEKVIGQSNNKLEMFDFILRDKLESSTATIRYLQNGIFKDKKYLNNKILEVPEWLQAIRDCHVVVTDSFHCTVFAIIFHKHFIAINDEKSGMNARINTLCCKLGLENRILTHFDTKEIDKLIADDKYNWTEIDNRRRQWASVSGNLLLDVLME